MYSRYAPPTKKQKIDSAPPPAILAADSAFSSQRNVTPTIPDASATYKRYVPPSKSKGLSSTLAQAVIGNGTPTSDRTSPQNVEFGETEVLPERPAIAENDAVDSDMPVAQEKKPKKKKKTAEEPKQNDGEGDIGNESIREDPRYASILARREKSLKKAEKIARKAAKKEDGKTDADADGDVEMEEAPELHPLEPFPQPEPVPESSGKPTFSSLPSWLAHPIKINPTAKTPFSDLGIPSRTIDVLRQKGFTEAFAVQAAVLPLLVQGKGQTHSGDLLVSAATGSGKTLAYVLPMTEYISKIPYTRLSGLIVMPTRELVSQAKEVCDICAAAFSHNGRTVKIGLAMGSQDLKKERATLMNQEQCYKRPESNEDSKKSGFLEDSDSEEFDAQEEETSLPDSMLASWPKIDILICTPGRLVEHLKSTPGFTLEYLKWLVIDEADKLLDQSFQEWIQTVMAYLPASSRTSSIRKVVLSATMTKDVSQLSALKLKSPKLVVLEGKKEDGEAALDMLEEDGKTFTMPVTLQETAIKVEEEADKPLYLLELLRFHKMMETNIQEIDDSASDTSSSEDDSDDTSSEEDTSSVSEIPLATPKSMFSTPRSQLLTNPHGVLIFTNSNENALRLSRLLTLIDPTLTKTLGTLSSTIPTSTRNKTLSSFQSGKISILIATDLVSRGLDLPNLAHVVNYDLPTSLRSYVHRVGRTARAGKDGWAWTLYTNVEGRWFWNDIGRSVLVERGVRKVDRGRIGAKVFGDELRARYEKSLEVLGQEARGQK